MPETSAETITAGTVNLARMMAETEARAEAIAAEIDSMNLDLFGGQETEEWLEWELAQRLAGDWLVVSDHVNCPIFARADKFQRVTVNKESWITLSMPGSVRKRYGSAALLKRMSDGLVFLVANLHPSNAGESSNSASDRVRQAEYVWDRLEQWGVTGYPMLILGDMNAKEWAPGGLPGVFVGHGMTDVLQELGQKSRIDRAFVKGFTPVAATVNPVAGHVSDHDFGVFVVTPGDKAAPEPDPTPETTLERLNRIHGKIARFKIASFEIARKNGFSSRYTAVAQGWLGREITCRWTADDQKALDDWRHREFPTWPASDYKGPVGPTSMTRLAQVAKAKGKKTYPIVK